VVDGARRGVNARAQVHAGPDQKEKTCGRTHLLQLIQAQLSVVVGVEHIRDPCHFLVRRTCFHALKG